MSTENNVKVDVEKYEEKKSLKRYQAYSELLTKHKEKEK